MCCDGTAEVVIARSAKRDEAIPAMRTGAAMRNSSRSLSSDRPRPDPLARNDAQSFSDLMLRRARSGRLEAWAATRGPSFETHRFAMLLRMRQKEGARSATKQSQPPGWDLTPQVQAPMVQRQRRGLAERTRDVG